MGLVSFMEVLATDMVGMVVWDMVVMVMLHLWLMLFLLQLVAVLYQLHPVVLYPLRTTQLLELISPYQLEDTMEFMEVTEVSMEVLEVICGENSRLAESTLCVITVVTLLNR